MNVSDFLNIKMKNVREMIEKNEEKIIQLSLISKFRIHNIIYKNIFARY